MSTIQTEIADLALSIKREADAIYQASTQPMPTAKKADVVARATCALRTKTRRWRKLMGHLIGLEHDEARADEARREELAALCVGSTSDKRDLVALAEAA